MSDQPTLSVQSRAQVGSGAARQLRRQGRTPAVLYGRGAPQPVTLSATDFRHAVPVDRYGSQMVRLLLDEQDAGIALVKAVQVNPLNRQVLSIDLQRVFMEDYVQITVPVILVGEPAEARRGGVLDQLAHAISLRCRVSDVPANITFDVSALEIGDAVRSGQLALPPNSELLDPPDQVIATLAPPTVPVLEEQMIITEGVTGPELTGDKQQDDSQLAA
jgi:large subunit ribosomal protein L25